MSPATAQAGRLLSDIEILERIVGDDDWGLFVSPLMNPAEQVGPSSLDLHLGTEMGVGKTSDSTHIDLTFNRELLAADVQKHYTKHRLGPAGHFVLHPREFALGSTLEYLRLPRDLAGRLEGRSSLGRLGLLIHATAGFVDPGFEGALTFEFYNAGKLPLRMAPGLRIGQICLFEMSPVQVSYMEKKSSKYGRRTGIELSKIAEDARP
jgi:dCTP deaminase